MQRKISEWPAKLRDGGWRTLAKNGNIFAPEFRIKRSKRQLIHFNSNLRRWELSHQDKRGLNLITFGDLSTVCEFADIAALPQQLQQTKI